jgi:hypothetical protein
MKGSAFFGDRPYVLGKDVEVISIFDVPMGWKWQNTPSYSRG